MEGEILASTGVASSSFDQAGQLVLLQPRKPASAVIVDIIRPVRMCLLRAADDALTNHDRHLLRKLDCAAEFEV